MMKRLYLIILLMVSITYFAGAQPSTPAAGCGSLNSGCTNMSSKKGGTPNMTTSGTPSFTLTSAQFSLSSITNNSLTVTINNLPVNSPDNAFEAGGVYTLYVAGTITYTSNPPGLPDTPIPLSAFTVAASTPGSASPSGVTLTNQYLPVATNVAPTNFPNSQTQTLTVKFNPSAVPMDTYQQAPSDGTGTRTLTLYLLFYND